MTMEIGATSSQSLGYQTNPGSHLGHPKGRYNVLAARVTGYLIFCGAVCCVILAIAQIVLESGIGRYGSGIWCAALVFMPCGVIGIISSYKKDANLIGRIVSDSVLSIVCLLEMITAIVASFYCCSGLRCTCCGGDIKPIQEVQEPTDVKKQSLEHA